MKKIRFIVTVIAALCLFSCKGGGNNQPPNGDAEEPFVDGDVIMYITTATRSQDFRKHARNFSDRDNMSPSTIKLEPATRFQTMDGFGASVTGSTCYNLMQMSAENRNKFLRQTFSHTEGFGHSYTRISIGASDFSLGEYTLCDTPGIENFALTTEETQYIIPILKEILAINPTLKIMGSPWTPPRWMKVNNLTDRQPHNSWTGGQLNPQHYADYAAYFVKWIQAFAAEGIKIHSVTPQNEPLHAGNSVSLFMGWQEQHEFVGNHMAPQFKNAGLDTKIYLFDHNYNYDLIADQQGYPMRIYEAGIDSDVVAGAAYHNYFGDRSELLEVQRLFPDRELVFTEASIGTWNDGRNLETRLIEDMREIGLGTVNNWCRAVIVWNLMLDFDRGPNRPGGCRTCFGAVDIDQSNYEIITRNSHYYMISHLAAVVKPGAVRIGTSGFSDPDFIHSAFENTDGTYALVAFNSSAQARTVTIDDGKQHFSYEVPARAVISYKWKIKI